MSRWRRDLPTEAMVYFVLTPGLFRSVSTREVLAGWGQPHQEAVRVTAVCASWRQLPRRLRGLPLQREVMW